MNASTGHVTSLRTAVCALRATLDSTAQQSVSVSFESFPCL